MAVNSYATTWYKVQPRPRGGATIKIGACVTAVGLFYAIAQTSAPYVQVHSASPNTVIAVDAQKRDFGPDKLQAEIDKSPVLQDFAPIATFTPNIAATPIPSKKPVFAADRRAIRRAIKTTVLNGKMPSEVLQFDQCDPRCETQDPLVVGSIAPTWHAVAPMIARDDDDRGFNVSTLQRTRSVLAHTADAPWAVLRIGRDVIRRFVD